MSFSYLALNDEANLRFADIKEGFMIELVMVSESWEMYVHTPEGNGDELKREHNEEMDPNLRSAISQAIRDDPRIGRIWVVQFTLFAAVDVETRDLHFATCDWYEALATAREKLARINEKPKTTTDHYDLSTERENPVWPRRGYSHYVIDEYQNHLLQLERSGKRRLETAKQDKQ
ncbi:hypothetical protein F1880_008376 [Penicillium rolfsii]|nr:hypothetical protein F1880_008376 [Penicillium rolfsii]